MATEEVLEFLRTERARITELLNQFTRSRRSSFGQVNRWGTDVLDRLMRYAAGGKMIRGSLVVLGMRLFESEDDSETMRKRRAAEAVKLGATIELIQSFLLIHDDIMDRDAVRRGSPTIHTQYRDIAPERGTDRATEPADREINLTDAASHFGHAMAICAGDISLLLAFELASSETVDAETAEDGAGAQPRPTTPVLQPQARLKILDLIAREISYVGLAQMNDVYHGATSEEATESDILALYRFKTGRYTFSLPLMIGAMLAEAPPESCALLGEFGEQLGVIFQVRDDEIGLFGTTEGTGKPTGSDIASAKQTLHRLYLKENSGDAWPSLAKYFGRPATAETLSRMQSAVQAYGVDRRLAALVQKHEERARNLIQRLSADARGRGSIHRISAPYVKFLEGLIEYNSIRTS